MLFSVIIPTCNRNELLALCLDKLAPRVQTIDKELYEVIVTDDGKNNEAKLLIDTTYPWVKWVEGPKKGPAANRNNGSTHANGEWLVFLDDDCLPASQILSAYKEAITNNPGVLAFEGRIHVDEPQSSFLQESPVNETGDCFWSCNININKSLFKTLNGFDEQFRYAAMEDVDFFYRIKQNNKRHIFVYEASVLHPWRKNKKLFSAILKRKKSQEYYLTKHPEEAGRINSMSYFRAFYSRFFFTLKNAFRFKFSGFGQKLCCDFLQLYFGLREVFSFNNRTKQDAKIAR